MATPQLTPDPGDQDLIAEFKKLMEDYWAVWQKAQAKGELTGEGKEKVAKIEEAQADILTKLNTQTTELKGLRERVSRPPGAGGGLIEFPGSVSTPGKMFVEQEAYKSFLGNPGQRITIRTTLKTRMVPRLELRVQAPFISEETSGLVMYPKRVGVFTPPTVPLVMRDLLDVIPLDTGNAIEYVLEAWVLNADYQIHEGDKKAQSDVTYTDRTAVVRTIAHYVKISRQMMADVPFIRASIDNRLVYGIALKEDKEILYGTGATGHLLGIMPQATAYAAGGLPVVGPIDQIYAGIVQVMSAGYAPSAIVLNPVDFAGMSLAKNSMGMYLLGGPPYAEATPRLWGLPVAMTMNMNPGEFLVGAFPGNAALFDRETTTVELSLENEDDFIRNLATIRAEERVTLAVFVPQAFVKGTLVAFPAPVGLGSEGTEKGRK